MKNYIIMKDDIFLYGYLTHGRHNKEIYDLCQEGKATLIYNDTILENYETICKNCTGPFPLNDEFYAEIEKVKKYGIKMNKEEIEEFAKQMTDNIYIVLASTLSWKDKSPQGNNGFTIIDIDEVPTIK